MNTVALFNHFIVFFMRTDPKPDIGLVLHKSQDTPSVRNANRIQFTDFLKMQRWMIRIFFPKQVTFFSGSLDFLRESCKQFTKSIRGSRFQRQSKPPSTVMPDSNSIFASSSIQCNLPSGAKSFSIIASQLSFRRSKMKAARISCSDSESSRIRSIACSSKAVITVKYRSIIFSQCRFLQ